MIFELTMANLISLAGLFLGALWALLKVIGSQAELPRDYVRRDDFVQAIGSISTRIDNFALRVERALDNRNGGHPQ